ncbi:cytochrome C oxidase subunit IV family protein [Pedobacter sp. SD-b]|uniref:Cytochrome C oxidase subunit IV family protein n=1 Tax=Pedobacter segetis TaxID=2793069 RepID=A0ABS1BKE0_9SPHI|nr:cytochrome C oxidase subunit IV family protein [Pedobacter segetis]MBK0383347.1 cytochrome C oxidase subunit IV family protein [Pedobacter segetis]
MSTQHSDLEHADQHETMSKKQIWKVFFILLGVTVVEFILALAIPDTVIPQHFKNFAYITLTLVKAFYIVAFFMHLKFEKYTMIVGVTVSFIFIIYFIILMLTEGNYLHLHMNV